MIRKTPYLKMQYFTTGESYNANADMMRLKAIETSIDVAMKVTGGGVISGWEVSKNTSASDNFSLCVSQGIGIIPVEVDENAEFKSNVPATTYESLSGIDPSEDLHYMGIRTNGDLSLATPSVGKSRISLIYVKLNNAFVSKYKEIVGILDPVNNPVTVTIGSGSSEQSLLINSYYDKWNAVDSLIEIEQEIQIEVMPGVNDIPSSGSYRNLEPQSEYPIYNYTIKGELNYNKNNNDFTVFVNGKSFHNEGFNIDGSTLVFNDPLQLEDLVTLRIEPKHSLILAEVETNENGIIRIDNTVRTSVYEKIGDKFVQQILSKHIHDNIGDSPDKILLTTETGILSSSSVSDDNTLYKFQKSFTSYSFNFDANTYTEEVYINGLLTVEPYVLTDTGSEIQIKFSSSLSPNSVVKIKLIIKDDFSQIDGKLLINDYNVSKEKIDIEVDAAGVSEGSLYSDTIPLLSHVGISNKIMKPCNPESGADYVHRTEMSYVANSGREFFPVYKDKSNGKGVTYLHSIQKESSDIVYACAPGGLLYVDREYLVGERPETAFVGWDMLSIKGQDSFGWTIPEFDNPIFVSDVKNSIASTDRSFVVGEKFVYSIIWDSGIPVVTEVINLTGDKQGNLLQTPGFTSILGACGGEGVLNLDGDDYTVYLLTNDSKVYCYEYSAKNRGESLYDIVSDPLWSEPEKIFGCTVGEDFVLFVSESSGEIYINQRILMKLNSSVNTGSVTIQGVFSPPSYLSSGESLIFAGDNSNGEKTQSLNIQSTFFDVSPALKRNYSGIYGTYYNTVVIRDWVKISTSSSFSGSVKKVICAFDKIFVLTDTNIYYTDYSSDIFSINSVKTWTNLTTTYSGFNDFVAVGDVTETAGYFVVAGETGVKRCYFNGSSLVVEDSLNSGYGESINNLLYPSYHVQVDSGISKESNVVYLCTKYGVFQSTDSGYSWRNTIQILGNPESKLNPIVYPEAVWIVLGKDIEAGRIFVTKQGYVSGFGYGYGYGFGEGLDYFDVLSPSVISSTYGHGVDQFEVIYENVYGYGYGYEILNPVAGIEDNDWVYFEGTSVSGYGQSPLRILGTGFDWDTARYYIDVEEYDGYSADLGQTFENQIIYAYKKTYPLPIIDGDPQNVIYGISDVYPYIFDAYRQSVVFDSYISEEAGHVEIASLYKCFELIESYDLSGFEDIGDNKIKWTSPGGSVFDGEISIDLGGVKFVDSSADYPYGLGPWIRNGNKFTLPYFWNMGHIISLTASGVTIGDIGDNSHVDIEDALSTEERGISYGMGNVRDSNFLNVLMAIQHKHPYIYPTTQLESVSGTVDSFLDYHVGGIDPYIVDSSKNYGANVLVGRKISFSGEKSTHTFTIIRNTSDRIYLQRHLRYNRYNSNILDSVGQKVTSFVFGTTAVYDSITVYVGGDRVFSGWSPTLSTDGSIVGVTFDTAPAEGIDTDLWVDFVYVGTEDFIDYNDVIVVGGTYEILTESISPFDNISNTFVSRYDEDDFILDEINSFIENSYLTDDYAINDNIGEYGRSLFYVYYDENNENFYAGTNIGVWKKSYVNNYFEKTGPMLSTLDATGTISIGKSLSEAYIQYNKTTEEWKVSWGGGFGQTDENNNLENIKINLIEVCPGNSNIIIAASDTGVYRSVDAGTIWECIWDTASDNRTKEYPEVKSIVFDDKHPWVINITTVESLYRSYNYGTTWTHIESRNSRWTGNSGQVVFSYQVDDSDARAGYYIAHSSFLYKLDNNLGDFGKAVSNTGSSRWTESIDIGYDSLFRRGITYPNVSSIVNSRYNPSIVYMSSGTYGVFRSYFLGYAPETYTTVDNINHLWTATGLASESLNLNYLNTTKTAEMTKTTAFNHLITSLNISSKDFGSWGYVAFVDYTNNKTYISFARNPMIRQNLIDGSLVGGYLYLKTPEKRFFKILEYYDRGENINENYFTSYHDEVLAGRRIELVVEGVLSPDYIPYEGARVYKSDDETFHIIRGDGWSSSGWLFLSFFGTCNGRTTKIKLEDLASLDCRVYAAREDGIFTSESYGLVVGESTSDKTFLILDFADISKVPVFMQSGDNALVGYAVGDSKQGEQYEIFESKDLPASSAYYVDIATGSGGARSENRKQYVCRIQDSTTSFTERTDVYNLWHRINFHELHNVVLFNLIYDTLADTDESKRIHFSQMVYEKINEFPLTASAPDDMMCSALWVGFDKGSLHEDTGIWEGNWPYTPLHTNPQDFVGKYVGHRTSNKKYKIIDAVVWDDSYDGTFPANYDRSNIHQFDTRILLRLEVYTPAYCDQASLYSCGEIYSSSDDKIYINEMGSIGENELRGVVIQIENTGASYTVVANSGTEIQLNKQSSSIQAGDRLVANYSLRGGSNSLAIKSVGGTEYLFTVSGGICYQSEDNGDSWKSIVYGVPCDSTTGGYTASFDKIKVYGNYLYAISEEEGIYRTSISDSNRSMSLLTDSSGEGLTSYNVYDISVDNDCFYVATGSGIYFLSDLGGIWQKFVLPDNDVTSVLTVTGDKDLQPDYLTTVRGDLDRIWMGTSGRGFYLRAKSNKNSEFVEENWGRSKVSEYFDEIRAETWKVLDIFYENGDIKSKSLFDFNEGYDKYDLGQVRWDFVPVSSEGISDPNNFEWSKDINSELKFEKENFFIVIDPSNAVYSSRGVSNIGTKRSSQKYHKLNDFTTSIEGFRDGGRTITMGLTGSLDKTKVMSGKGSFFVSFGTSVYENPFKHFPDRSSITTIESVPDGPSGDEGTIVLGTDRNGVWRTNRSLGSGKKRAGYILPIPRGTNNVDEDTYGNEFGYNFDPWKFTVLDKDLTDPPADPSEGDVYIVASGATGDWNGHVDEVAEYLSSAWSFTVPTSGLYVWVDDESIGYKYTASWASTTFPLNFFDIDDNIVWFGTDTESDGSIWSGYQGSDIDGIGDKRDWFYKSIETSKPVRRYADNKDDYDTDFYFKREKFYYFTVYDDLGNGDNGSNLYDDINSLSDPSDVVGGYFVVSEYMNEVYGPVSESIDDKGIRAYKIEAVASGADGGHNVFVLKLSAGNASGSSSDQNKIEGFLDRWKYDWDYRHAEDISDPLEPATKTGGWDVNRNARCCIIDFESYEKIDAGLPTLSGIKNSQGDDEAGLFVRDMSIGDIVYSDYPAVIACGINGVYVTDDITEDISTFTWSEWTLVSDGSRFSYDATSVVFNSSTGEIYVGTWGDGIFRIYKDGSGTVESVNTGLDHKNIWCLFETAGGDIYAGTEHGGVYKFNSGTEVWARESGITRSQIFVWKSESIPKNISGSLDYSNAGNAISYSWGGGVMQSTDSGSTWAQSNSGLENYYIQDVSICPVDDSNKYVAYASTCGGGVFRTENAFEFSGSDPLTVWKPLSTDGLPETLNITDVEVGEDPDKIFIKANINGLSMKDVPYEMRGMASSFIRPFVRLETFEGVLRTEEGYLKYDPITPYRNGDLKHVVYQGDITDTSGDTVEVTWTVLYDKDPDTIDKYTFSSNVFGLKIVPGTSDEIRFLYNYELDYISRGIYSIDTKYVSISSGVITEKDFTINLDEYGFNRRSQYYFDGGEIYISIDPVDTDIVYLSVANRYINKDNYGIFRSDSDGTSWSLNLALISDYKCGFNTGIQISTKNNGSSTYDGFFVEFDLSSETYTWDISSGNTVITFAYGTTFTSSFSSLAKYSGALNGCVVSFGSDFTNTYSVISHEAVSGGDITFTISGSYTGTKINFLCSRPIYANFGNDVFGSIDKGEDWFQIETGDLFADPFVGVRGVVEYPVSNITDISIIKSKFVVYEYLGDVYLARGDLESGKDASSTIWTNYTIIAPVVSSDNLMDNCLVYSSSDDTMSGSTYLSSNTGSIYLSEKHQIRDLATGTIHYSGAVDYPLVVSEMDDSIMGFVSGSRFYYTEDAFNDTLKSVELPFTGTNINKIIIRADGSLRKEIFIAVNGEVEYKRVSLSISSFSESVTSNYVIFQNTQSVFKVGDKVSFYDDDIVYPYSSEIVQINSGGSVIKLSNTVSGKIEFGVYDKINNKSIFTVNVEIDSLDEYVGNVLTIFSDIMYSTKVYKGVLSDFSVSTSSFTVSVDGDLALTLETDYNIDFSNNYAYLRIGKISDFIDSDFSGTLFTTQKTSPVNNGLWHSSAYGGGLKKVDNASLGDDDFGCDNVFTYTNGAVNAVMSARGVIRTVINDLWMPSSNINRVDIAGDGRVVLSTDFGIGLLNFSTSSKSFSNYYFGNYKLFNVSTNKYYIFDDSGNMYIINSEFSGKYNGYDSLTPILTGFGTVNKAFVDLAGNSWIATEDGVRVISSTVDRLLFPGENVKDVMQDSSGKIWLCLGSNGVVSSVSSYGDLEFEWISFNEQNNLSGSIDGIVQRYGLIYKMDGNPEVGTGPNGIDDPYVTLEWNNSSSLYVNILLLRSETGYSPNANGNSYKSRITGIVDTVSSASIVVGGITTSVWEVKIKNINVSSIAADETKDRFLFFHSKIDSTNRVILSNGTSNNIYVERIGSEPAPSVAGYNISIEEKIDNSYVLYSGSGSINESLFIDREIVDGTTYYYHLYFYASSQTYNLIDSKVITIADEIAESSSYDIYCVGTDGVFSFNGFGDRNFSKESYFGSISYVFVDSLNRLWMSSVQNLVMYTPGQQLSYDKNFLFTDQNTVPSGIIEIRNCVESSEGYLYVATNLGLASFSLVDQTNISYIENDSDRIIGYQTDLSTKVNDWHVTSSFKVSTALFSQKNSVSDAYMVLSGRIYETDNYGLNWDYVNETEIDPKFFINTKGEDDSTIEYFSFMGSNYSRHINENGFIVLESLPSSSVVSTKIGSAGHVCILESTSGSITNGMKMLVGVVNNRIAEDEVEILKINYSTELNGSDSSGNPDVDQIGASQGLAIQSVYDFCEITSDNSIYAGCKDHIMFLDGLVWRVVPFNNDSSFGLVKYGEPYAFTALDGRLDTGSIDSYEGKIVYATKTPLYGSPTQAYFDMRYGFRDLASDEIFSFRVGLSGSDFMPLDEMAIKYVFNNSIIDSKDLTILPFIDRPSFAQYYPQRKEANYLTGHIGAIKFIDGQKTLLTGGFDNTIFLTPFTSEKDELVEFSKIEKKFHFVLSGKRDITNMALPFTNEAYHLLGGRYYYGYLLSNLGNYYDYGNLQLRFNHRSTESPTYFDVAVKPKNGWTVSFDDQVGYASFMEVGQSLAKTDLDKVNFKEPIYTYTSETDKSSVFKTNDGGMLWQQFTNSNYIYPNAIISDFKTDGTNLFATSLYASGISNVGVFKINETTREWTQCTLGNADLVPGTVLSNIDGDVYAGTSGCGIFKYVSGTTFEEYDSRFNTQKGLGVGVWHVNSICEDPKNKKRVIAGTRDNGIIECLNAGSNIDDIKWNFDIVGIPTGNVTNVSILPANSGIVLASVLNDGLYRKSLDTGVYEKITSGLPTLNNVKQIHIDNNVTNTYVTFNYIYSGSDTLVILRSSVEPPSEMVDDTIYYLGGRVGNADLIYMDDGDFTNNEFIDSSPKLISGPTYYYRFFEKDGTDYTEIGSYTGTLDTIDRDTLVVTVLAHDGSDFSGIDLSGLILTIDSGGLNEQKYKIISNTVDTITFELDEGGVLNINTIETDYVYGMSFIVESSIAVTALTINPVYVVTESLSDNVSRIYRSLNNGEDWSEVSLFGTFIFDQKNINRIITTEGESYSSYGVGNRVIYATTETDVLKSFDSGTTWEIISTDETLYDGSVNSYFNGLPNLYNSIDEYYYIFLDNEDANIIYITTKNGKFYRSINRGITWGFIGDFEKEISDIGIVSYQTNYIYTGSENGMIRFDDLIRDKVEVTIDVDGKLTRFDIDYFEMGDYYFTDLNSILAKTLVKNDDSTDNREQIRFKIDDNTKFLSIKFKKNKESLDSKKINIGEDGINPLHNPFVLQNPNNTYTNIVINKIGNISDDEIYALTNFGIYTSNDGGSRWSIINSASLPKGIMDLTLSGQNSELALATEDGLWLSANSRTEFKQIESNGQIVNTVWRYDDPADGCSYLFRGGDEGLLITVERSRSLVVFSGERKQNVFCWGDLFYPNDGGWSDATISDITIPIPSPLSSTSTDVTLFDDWDYALIVRKGPYLDYNRAYSDSLNRNVFIPNNQVVYPSALSGDYIQNTSPHFVSSSSFSNGYLEEIRDVNLYGGVGSSFSGGSRYMSDGSIIIGIIPNRRGNPPNSSVNEYYSTNNIPYDYGPSTKYPVIDEVQPFDAGVIVGLSPTNPRGASGITANTAEDESYYDGTIKDSILNGRARCPELIENAFYIYTVYPYIMLPDPLVVGSSSTVYSKYPRYRPEMGDVPQSYSYILKIEKFSGSNTFFCGVSVGSSNWIVGTDSGIFYSRNNGRDVFMSNIKGKVPAVFYSSDSVAFASVVLDNGEVQVVTSSADVSQDIVVGQKWEAVSELQSVFFSVGVKIVYNFVEYNNEIYLSTNAGLVIGSLSTGNWRLYGSIGNIESLSSGRVLGQGFEIK